MRKFIFYIMFISGLTYTTCAQQKTVARRQNSPAETKAEKKNIKYGIASFYAKKFNGRRTANGEIYSDLKFTAACNVLPLDTWIKVTNMRNKKVTIVKVNDRMHPKNKRLVDLSGIAAKKLGYTGRGLTRVKIEVIKKYNPKKALSKIE